METDLFEQHTNIYEIISREPIGIYTRKFCELF
jgi:hypothetical protein